MKHPLSQPLIAVLALLAQPALAEPPAGYVLVWADEFDIHGLPDPARWTYDTEANATGWYNNEKQYYAVANLQSSGIDHGQLHITARREQLTSAADYGGQDYSSARLITSQTQSWTHGYFEISARLPCGQGTWPAFWMLGSSDSAWPDGGEIDIMEQVGSEPNVISGTIHTKATEGTWGIGGQTVIEDPCGAFHTYQMLWTGSEIMTGVDGDYYFTYKNAGLGHDQWPFGEPHHLLVNLAIGGDMAGAVDDAIFPVTMDVDYVRVYQVAP